MRQGFRELRAKVWSNRFHNRLWIILGRRLFIRVPGAAKMLHPSNLASQQNKLGQIRTYRSVSSLFVKSQFDWGATAPHHGMFGNSVAGLIPIIGLALESNFKTVFVLGESPFTDPELFDASGTHDFDGEIRIEIHESPELVSTGNTHGLVHATTRTTTSPKNAERAWQILSAALLGAWDLKPLGPEVLAIHLRGGDVFRGTRDLPNHGQPPASFFTAVIESSGLKEVVVVHQGDVPQLEPIRDFCQAKSINISTHSKTLKEDLRILLGASNLVCGRGSFAPAVAGLAPLLRRVYFFESGFGFTLDRPSVTLCRAVDKSGAYVRRVLSNNWRRSKTQLRLMTSYPQSNIRVPNCF